jgi:NAD(P)-dependent dehydrogenase (short-subunit alcohol dehydrogenase family)
MTAATPGIVQDLDPAAWRRHRFGLPEPRWAALAGRTFWITGAGTGYGRAMALALAAAGARAVISGRRAEKLGETIDAAARLSIAADHFLPLACDITRPDEVAAAAASLSAQGITLSAVVNNAALPLRPRGLQALLAIEPEEWRALLATNVMGAWLVTRAALPSMMESGSIRALFITSEAGWANTAGMGPYNVSKAALNSLGMSFAEECAAACPNADVQINVLDPGEAATEMNQGSKINPFAVANMGLALLSHPRGGPNGCFFHRDGRHLSFAYSAVYRRSLFETF